MYDVAEHINRILDEYANASPEKKRDMGSSLITLIKSHRDNGDIELINNKSGIRTITAQYVGTCRRCRKRFDVGEEIAYKKDDDGPQRQNDGPYHIACV